MELDYDEEGDVLYISWGSDGETENIDREDDIVVRRDPETGDIVGFTVLNFRERTRETAPVQETVSA